MKVIHFMLQNQNLSETKVRFRIESTLKKLKKMKASKDTADVSLFLNEPLFQESLLTLYKPQIQSLITTIKKIDS